MKIYGWNCRAASSPPAVWSLLDLQEHVRPVILFLSETNLNNEGAEALHRKLGYDSMCVGERVMVEPVGSTCSKMMIIKLFLSYILTKGSLIHRILIGFV
jgi:hypothetical protein